MKMANQTLPWTVNAEGSSEKLIEDWAKEQRDRLDDLLAQHKAILLRGFRSRNGLESVADSLFAERLTYTYRSTPRTTVGRHIYTATEYPKQLSIPQHCENAYQRRWPLKLMFYCAEPAQRGGATPIADVARVTAAIPEEIKREFERKKVRYVRNYRAGVDLPWQEVFCTENVHEVEQFCALNQIECTWTEAGLRTSQVCQAFAEHPRTGERLWFNQAHLFHVSALDDAAQAMMLKFFGEEGLPRNAYYGDGTAIDREVVDQVRAAFSAHQTAFEWQQGDVLLVDNMLVSHGREPFEGERKVLVCMSEPYPN
jgi:alpha-ketoglutarate-dependent taurine dioxygenase